MTNHKSIKMTMSTGKEHLKSLSFGLRLMRERKRLGLTQKEAADRCGVRREMWGRYERDEALPGVALLEQFSAIGARSDALLNADALEFQDVTTSLLGEIASQLGLSGSHHELAEIAEKIRMEKRELAAEWNEPDANKTGLVSHPRASHMVESWLRKSPDVLKPGDWGRLESAIDAVEFAASVAREPVERFERVSAIRALWLKAKQSNADDVSRTDVQELVKRFGGTVR